MEQVIQYGSAWTRLHLIWYQRHPQLKPPECGYLTWKLTPDHLHCEDGICDMEATLQFGRSN